MTWRAIPKRPLGKTGWHSTILALGGVGYQRLPEREAVRIVEKALELGINHIDTARSYGESEVIIGKALQGRREQVFLATKTR